MVSLIYVEMRQKNERKRSGTRLPNSMCASLNTVPSEHHRYRASCCGRALNAESEHMVLTGKTVETAPM